MKNWVLLGAFLASMAWSENLVKNGGFDDGGETALYGSLPVQWSGDGVSRWRFVNDDGVSGACSVLAEPENGDVTPLVQEVVCKQATAYMLKASLKSDGCVPVVTVSTLQGAVLAQLKGDLKPAKLWKEKSIAFKTGKDDAKLKVTLTVEGKKGRANVDSEAMTAVSAVKGFSTDKENLALHKPYTCFTNARRYGLCTDAGDKVQLTDGQYTKGYFWTQKSTVGWTTSSPVEIRVDLGSVQPICGFSYNLAGGRAGVAWPKSILVYASEDGENWWMLGDLYAKSCEERGAPLEDVYAVYRAATLDMPARGRYVSFVISQKPYCFVDEIEIYKGDPELLTKDFGTQTLEPMADYQNQELRKHLMDDLEALEAPLSPAEKARFKADFDQVRKELDDLRIKDVQELNTIVPYCAQQESLFALNGKLLRAKGFSKPMLWHNNRWDNLSPFAVPASKKVDALTVEMMRGEIRAETVNILNPTDKPIACRLTVEGLPKEAGIDCREVLYTDTKQFVYVSGALKPGDGASISLKVEPGISRQVWLSFKKPSLPKGAYKAQVKVAVDGKPALQVPLTLNIYDLDFPKQPRLHVGGWDYLQGKGDYYKAPNAVEANLAMMRSIYVDSPWGTSAVLPKGAKFDQDGHLTNPKEMDFSGWITWEERWKGARQWCVFAAVRDRFEGERMGTPRFETMIVEYYRAFLEFLKTRGIASSQLIILLVDEPYNHSRDEVIIGWGRPLKKALPELVLFEDPIYTKPEEAIMEMYDIPDILCPNTLKITMRDQKPFFLNYKAKGTTLWLYSCSGPARILDPIAYHRGQMWNCFEMGAKGAFYWALGCGGGIGDSWHAFKQPGTEYSPYFVSQTDTMDAKQSEGVREGVQDYELLCMLQDKVEAARNSPLKKSKCFQAAEKLLTEGVTEVVQSIAPKEIFEENYGRAWYWSQPKDRSVMDRVRIQALKLLAEWK